MLYTYYDDWVNVVDLKEFEYCPVIPWIHHNIGYVTDPTDSMDVGRSRVDASFKVKVASELGLPKPYRVEVPVKSYRLRVEGVVDLVAGDGKLVVVEVKAFRRRRDRLRHFKTQLVAYALLVTESLGVVREAILYNGGDVMRFRVTGEMLLGVERKLAKLRAVIEGERPPEVSQPRQKCYYCWYRRVCPVTHPS
jgi:CRISPR-associated exonuclease Cas4